mmetsp:Transcript_100831/g.323604  ORF Transcript_100831/g.323604 Transcript_100831/m.323604 type:complete len:292 (-) Transcript_100831:714-1589(-)
MLVVLSLQIYQSSTVGNPLLLQVLATGSTQLLRSSLHLSCLLLQLCSKTLHFLPQACHQDFLPLQLSLSCLQGPLMCSECIGSPLLQATNLPAEVLNLGLKRCGTILRVRQILPQLRFCSKSYSNLLLQVLFACLQLLDFLLQSLLVGQGICLSCSQIRSRPTLQMLVRLPESSKCFLGSLQFSLQLCAVLLQPGPELLRGRNCISPMLQLLIAFQRKFCRLGSGLLNHPFRLGKLSSQLFQFGMQLLTLIQRPAKSLVTIQTAVAQSTLSLVKLVLQSLTSALTFGKLLA